MCKLLFCSTNAIFCRINDIFLVCRKKNFERAVQTFATLWYMFCCLLVEVLQCFALKNFERTVQTFAAFKCEFCRLIARVLSPYGTSFAALWSVLGLMALNWRTKLAPLTFVSETISALN